MQAFDCELLTACCEQNMTVEIAELDPPRSFAVRSLDAPSEEKTEAPSSRSTTVAGRVSDTSSTFGVTGPAGCSVPLVAKRQAQRGTPRNMEKLKKRLESGA